MNSKKFAVFFSILLLFTAMAGAGMIFFVLRLQAESEVIAANTVRDTPSSPASVSREDWSVSRSGFSAVSAQAAGADVLYHIGRYKPVFYNMGDENPKDTVLLHIVQILEQDGNWKRIRTLNGEKWIDMDWRPGPVLIDVPGLNQQALGLPTGCEIVALAMVINKYSDVSVFDLIEEMPRSYDPLLGFRGDPFTRGGFTILPPALMELTERHLGSAKDMTGASIEDVQAQLTQGRPVLTWLRGMFGFTVHVITLTGFSEYGFYYNDPWLGGVNEFISYDDFLAMWEDPIRDLRLNRVYPPRIALSY